MSARDGGPAFPTDVYWDEKRLDITPGMSLRDYFAAHAVLTPSDIEYANRHYPNGVASILAGIRYQYADAMLAERQKTVDDPAKTIKHPAPPREPGDLPEVDA